MATLFLIPNFLGNNSLGLIPQDYLDTIYELRSFIIESEKSARAFLKAIKHPLPQDDFQFFLMDKRMKKQEIPEYFEELKASENMGLLSDAGTPCIADPGSKIVDFALSRGMTVTPMAGLNSIIMALMASGFNGQQFKFWGYLPFEKKERTQVFAEMRRGVQNKETQIFIETPYRNIKLVQELTQRFSPEQLLAVVSNLSLENEIVDRRDLYGWLTNTEYLNKVPAVFVLGTSL